MKMGSDDKQEKSKFIRMINVLNLVTDVVVLLYFQEKMQVILSGQTGGKYSI